ncbi:MAG: bile acid:sodium symporter [Planctomycetaceae bacterium]
MFRVIQNRWFVISLAVLIATGLTLGARLEESSVAALTGFIEPRIWLVTALVLFLMSFSLNSGQLAKSFQSPAPVIWAFAVNFGFIPLLGWGLMNLQLQPDFRYGLIIACCVPCTMAAASVWTRKAGGNDAVALLVTVTTNGLCFLLTPFWLKLAAGSDVQLDLWWIVRRLVYSVLVPAVVGQLARLIPAAARFATRHKTPIGVVAQACILTIVFSAACSAGGRLGGLDSAPSMSSLAVVWGSCILVHLAAMVVAATGARGFGFSRPDWVAVAFAGSQKTLPVGVLLATDPQMFGNPDLLGPGVGIPFAVFPMLLYHASQLFIDTAIADRFRKRGEAHEM